MQRVVEPDALTDEALAVIDQQPQIEPGLSSCAAGSASRPSRSAARATANTDGSYSINNVAGPDEYSNGVDDGVFTNAGTALTLRNATRAAAILGEQVRAQWTVIADPLRMPFDDQNQVVRRSASRAVPRTPT